MSKILGGGGQCLLSLEIMKQRGRTQDSLYGQTSTTTGSPTLPSSSAAPHDQSEMRFLKPSSEFWFPHNSCIPNFEGEYNSGSILCLSHIQANCSLCTIRLRSPLGSMGCVVDWCSISRSFSRSTTFTSALAPTRDYSFKYNLGIVLGHELLIVDFQFDVLELQVSAWK